MGTAEGKINQFGNSRIEITRLKHREEEKGKKERNKIGEQTEN